MMEWVAQPTSQTLSVSRCPLQQGGSAEVLGAGAAASIFFRKLLGTFYTTGFENYCLITNVQKKHLLSSWLMLLTFDSSGERRKQQGWCVCPRTHALVFADV